MKLPSRSTGDIQDELDVLAAQCGEAGALRGVAERWQPRLLAYAHRLTGDREGARDVVQETWVSVVRGIGSLRDPAGFRPWVYRILTRRAADWVRRRQTLRKEIEAVREAGRPEAAPAPALEQLRESVALLPPAQREILVLHYTEGLGLREIAEVLKVPQGTVKSRLFTARETLRKKINPNQNTK